MEIIGELQRHQLVTEFNIQSQSELEDYQVQLADVDNPTQAQDNLIVGIDGTPLPHWNESVDFDTWVKININISGKRGLLIHGNDGVSIGSSGDDTFIFFDDFEDGTYDKWTQGSGATLSIYTDDTKYLHGSHSTSIGSKWNSLARANMPSMSEYIVDGRVKFGEIQSVLTMHNSANTTFYGIMSDDTDTMYVYEMNADVRTTVGNTGAVYSGLDSTIFQDFSASISSSGVIKLTLNGNTGTFPTDTTLSSGMFGMAAYEAIVGNICNIDDIRVRKYAAIEPTVTTSTPKNIATALKSFGRAG